MTETEKPASDGLEIVAWRGGKEDGSRKYTEIKRVAEIWADQNLTVIPLVRADQAQSLIAELRGEVERLTKERDLALDLNKRSHKHLAWEKEFVRAETAEAEVKRLAELAERLKLEAQGHASEARTANSTIYEIYQVLSGGKGEPGNWHGAEPARRYVETAEAHIKALEEALNEIRELNMTAEDENGHRWANSDLIDQTIMLALSTLNSEGKVE